MYITAPCTVRRDSYLLNDLLRRYEAFVIDLDGVVWRGKTPVDGAPEAIAAIRAAGKPLVFLTNNGARSPSEVAGILTAAGIAASASEVLTSAMVAASVIEEQGLTGKAALVLGSSQMRAGFGRVISEVSLEESARIEVVIVGRDTQLTWEKLVAASNAIRDGALFIALNKDATLPVEGGLEPGTGAIVAALETATGVPALVVGKPEVVMMRAAEEILGAGPILMIGDRLDSDIAGANAMGWGSALVLTGVSAPEDVKVSGQTGGPKPTYVIDALGDLAR